MQDLDERVSSGANIVQMIPKNMGSDVVYEAEPLGRLYRTKKYLSNGFLKRKGAILQVATGLAEGLLAYLLYDHLDSIEKSKNAYNLLITMGVSTMGALAINDIGHGVARMFSRARRLDYNRGRYIDASAYTCMVLQIPSMLAAGAGEPGYAHMMCFPEKEPRKQ
jgi:hypothetical protein